MTKKNWVWKLNGASKRNDWVKARLAKLEPGSKLLDAGAGVQPFKEACTHLVYYAQDFGFFAGEARAGYSSKDSYFYPTLDYQCDITQIPVDDGEFDAILCTEVLEHLPHPELALQELARVNAPGGTLILTVPSHSMRHFDPYYFTAGYSDHWLKTVLVECGYEDVVIVQNGDYWKFIRVELIRISALKRWLLPLSAPLILVLSMFRETEASRATAGLGYLVTARRARSETLPMEDT